MNIDINNVTPTMIVLGIVVFAVVYYLSYTLITKDMKEEDVDYKYQLYSVIPSLIISVGVVYAYETYKPKNNERLTGGFYN